MRIVFNTQLYYYVRFRWINCLEKYVLKNDASGIKLCAKPKDVFFRPLALTTVKTV